MGDAVEFMKEIARAIEGKYGHEGSISQPGSTGMVDHEILCRPKRATAATITMFAIANTFTISIVNSPIVEWQSEEWILYEGDDEKDLELGKLWLLDIFERIVNYGVRLVRIESLLPPFFRETRILFGDETSDRKFKVLEEYDPWH